MNSFKIVLALFMIVHHVNSQRHTAGSGVFGSHPVRPGSHPVRPGSHHVPHGFGGYPGEYFGSDGSTGGYFGPGGSTGEYFGSDGSTVRFASGVSDGGFGSIGSTAVTGGFGSIGSTGGLGSGGSTGGLGSGGSTGGLGSGGSTGGLGSGGSTGGLGSGGSTGGLGSGGSTDDKTCAMLNTDPISEDPLAYYSFVIPIPLLDGVTLCPSGSVHVTYEIPKNQAYDSNVNGFTCTANSWVLKQHRAGKTCCRMGLHYNTQFVGYDAPHWNGIHKPYYEAMRNCYANGCNGLVCNKTFDWCWLKVETPAEAGVAATPSSSRQFWTTVCGVC